MAGWISKEVARLDEMSQRRLSLRVAQMQDGDITVQIDYDGMPVTDESGVKAIVEFCSTSGGGGQSPAVRSALLALMQAVAADNRNDPHGIPPYPVYLREQQERANDAP